jgi:hypothetical protein
VNVARTFVTGGRRLSTVTPRFGVNANYFVLQAAPLTPAAGLTLSVDIFTMSTNVGVNLGFAGGSALDLAIGASNLLGATQSYDLHARLRVPLN